MTRKLRKGDDFVEIEIGSAWKLYDNHSIHNSISIYHGPIYRSKERVFWIETDEGGFVVDPKTDIDLWSKKIGMHSSQLIEILQDPKNKYLSIC